MTTETTKRCSRCGETFTLTTGFCRSCRAAYLADYYRTRMTEAQKAMNREAARNWWRRTHGVTPDRYRGVHRIAS